MEEEWTKLIQVDKPYQAEMIKQVLEECEIPCVVVNKQDSSFKYGYIEVFVRNIDIEKAREITQNQQP